jgi:ESAT-6 family protein
MAQMTTDAAVLSTEASSFGRIAGELKGVIANVESTAGSLSGQWHGQAGASVQAALARFHEAAAQQTQPLNDIAQNIHHSGVQHSTTDEDQAHSLSTAMGDCMGGPVAAASTGPSVSPQFVTTPQPSAHSAAAAPTVTPATSLGNSSAPTIQAAAFSPASGGGMPTVRPVDFKQDTPSPVPAPPARRRRVHRSNCRRLQTRQASSTPT